MGPTTEKLAPGRTHRGASVVEARSVVRRFGRRTIALNDVCLEIGAGEIHALLGPNGAGKTTLLRILTGLVHPDAGTVRIMGFDAVASPRALRQRLGLVPSGDRSFYLRISGLENLVFFARLYGLSRRAAIERADEVLDQVGLSDAARTRVGLYSHGMQKRLSVARALLPQPAVLLLDEPTHDLDPRAARAIRDLVRELAARGAAVVWATQRIEEIRGFADTVTLLHRGEVRFAGTVPDLLSHSIPRRYLLRVRNGSPSGGPMEGALNTVLAGAGSIVGARGEGSEHYVLELDEEVVLGDALRRLMEGAFQILACSEERSEIEEAFLALTPETAQ
jgi:ABC-type multidrug transport system ATPase subunit